MINNYAKDFSEISESLNNNPSVKSKVLNLVQSEPIAGEVITEDYRLNNFREILLNFFNLKNDFNTAVTETEKRLSRNESMYSNDNRVFAKGWSERLVRTQISRFYNQAVLESIIEGGSDECFIEHSANEQDSSQCSQQLAGTIQSANTMLERLKRSYGNGEWSKDLKIPDHPYCKHTFTPLI